MSKVRTLALGAMLLAGVASVSDAQASSTPRTRPDGGSYDRDHGRMKGPGIRGRRGHGGRGGFALGRELNLTEAQRAQIQAIHQKYQPQRKALHDRARPFLEGARTARQNWDSAGFRRNTEQARQILNGGEAIRAQELAEIRAVLTAEQRAKFDAREKEIAERRSRAKAEGGRRGMKPRGLRGAPATPRS